jgi:hypothetical protein
MAKPEQDRMESSGGRTALRTLAERLCPHKTDGAPRSVLVPSCGRPLTPEHARARAYDRVAAVVARTCDWGRPVTDWHVGDYRFLVLEIKPARDVCLYVQIWSEPEEPVLVEVCSGAWNPTARPFVGPRQRAALRKRGYAVGGRARNYRKYWDLSPLADARALAAELVGILVDILGYRGNRALGMAYCSEGRTEEGLVFPALAVDDVKRMLGLAGCQVVDTTPTGPIPRGVTTRVIRVAQPFPFFVEMRIQTRKAPASFDAMRLVAPLPAGRGLPPQVLELIARECPFGRIIRDNEGDLLFVHDLLVAGTTVRWFLMTLHVWKQTAQHAVEMLRLALGPPAPAGPGDADGPGGGDDSGDAGIDDEDEVGEPRQAGRARVTIH